MITQVKSLCVHLKYLQFATFDYVNCKYVHTNLLDLETKILK